MEPFNIKIQNTTQGAEKPTNQEVTQNADGSGGPISIAKKNPYNICACIYVQRNMYNL